MECLLSHSDINYNNIVLKFPIKNQNSQYNSFYKLVYSEPSFNLKYILLRLEFEFYTIYQNQGLYYITVPSNDPFFKHLYEIERKILSIVHKHSKKKIVYSCYLDLITKHSVYCLRDSPDINKLCIKISGVWESDNEVGLVYKIHYNMSTEKLLKTDF